MIADVIESLKKQLGAVSLMAVSKTRTLDEVRRAVECGQRLFGENHVQEIEAKFAPGAGLPSFVRCEMIGHLQSNKVRKAVMYASRIDSVDSVGLALKISDEALRQGKVMPVLLEVNCSGEDAKTGFSPDTILSAADGIRRLPGIRIEGFMTVGPVLCTVGTETWKQKTRSAFRDLRAIRDEAVKKWPGDNMCELSMGMSHDWEIAVEEGSTMVRIGTMIFGERNYG